MEKHIDIAIKRREEIVTGNVEPVPLIDLLLPLLENMSDEELEELYKDLKNNN
jgi:hypothetical protein